MKVLIPFFVILICVGMYFLYISPTAMEVKILSAKKVEYDYVISQSRELNTERTAVQTQVANISSVNMSRLSKAIPDTFDSVLFANDINNMAKNSGLGIRDIKVNEPKTEVLDTIMAQPKNQPFKTTVTSFRLTGTYQQFLGFLSELETSLRLMDVVGLSAQSSGSSKSGESSIDFSLEVNTYSLR